MLFHKKIINCVILIIMFYTVYTLFEKRRQLKLEGMFNLGMFNRGMFNRGVTNRRVIERELSKMNNKAPSGITSLTQNNNSHVLRQYCIKSSYNSAVSGKFVSTNAIKYVLSRGCRFIDLEVFLINDDAQVAYTDDSTFITVKTKNYITLNSALQTLAVNAFSAPSPNSSDPLFVQLRIKSKNSKIYNLVGMAVSNYLSNKLYAGKVTGNTPLSSLMGKVVLIIDSSLSPDYNKKELYPKCVSNDDKQLDKNDHCFNLSQFVNIESGTSNLRRYTYKSLLEQTTTPPVLLDSEKTETDVSLLRLVCPDDNDYRNPVHKNFIDDYGVQFISFKFYVADAELKMYEEFFAKHMSAFVPLSTAITVANKT